MSEKIEELAGYLSSIDRKMDQLREENRELRRTVERLIKISESIDRDIQRTRVDLAARLHLTSVVMALLDYVSVTSKLETLKSVEGKLGERLKEVKELYGSKIREIMRDYVDAISDFFGHFIRRARGDLDLIRGVLSKEKVLKETYEILDPSFLDPELVKIALENDTIERMKDAHRTFEILTEASKLLEDASKLEENFKGMLAKYEVRLPSEVTLLVPIIGIEAHFDGKKLMSILGPAETWETVPQFSKRAADYASSFIESYPVELTREQVSRVKQLLLNLARDEDEKKLIEQMELVV